jgi:hypothetical protein
LKARATVRRPGSDSSPASAREESAGRVGSRGTHGDPGSPPAVQGGARNGLSVFFLVLARDRRMVESKILELESYGFPYRVVCGEEMAVDGVEFRMPIGKWDALNYGCSLIPEGVDVVAINDVDTTIHQLESAIALASKFDLVYSAVKTDGGPQRSFYAFADPLRERLNLFASGELMLVRRRVLDRLLPVPPCMAEDSYLLFRAMELNLPVKFCRTAYVTTSRTANPAEEAAYKERTTLGILQALDHARPPLHIRLFYRMLPALAIPLLLMGENGHAWGTGIARAVRLHIEGSRRTRF